MKLRNRTSFVPPAPFDERYYALVVNVCVAVCQEVLQKTNTAVGTPVALPHPAQLSLHGMQGNGQDGLNHDTPRAASGERSPDRLRGQAPVDAAKLLLTVEEAAKSLGVGRTLMYTMVMRGQIASIKVGRTRRIPVTALHDFIARELGAWSGPDLVDRMDRGHQTPGGGHTTGQEGGHG